MEKDEKIFIAGHGGMIGSALLRRLIKDGFKNVVISYEMDLTDQKSVFDFFMKEEPCYVFLGSAKIGGIPANSRYPAEFIYSNLQTQANVIHSAWKSGVNKLEPTSEPYAIAKIAGIRMCQSYNRQYGTDYISAIPADIYGPDDDFNPETGHVLPALISKMYEAKSKNKDEVVVWGSGSPRRECLHVDDLADACLFLMENYKESEMINIGSGEDLSIKEMAQLIKDVSGYPGEIVFDTSKPDGAPRKLLDVSKIKKLGWSRRIAPDEGIRQTYQWYMKSFGGN
jgi:GDP-L-fucose synthase